MIILLITSLLLASLVVVLYPILKKQNALEFEDAPERLIQGFRRARDRVYEELQVLQQEHFLKNTSGEEHKAQLQKAKIEAALLLRQQRLAQTTIANLDRALEDEVQDLINQTKSTL